MTDPKLAFVDELIIDAAKQQIGAFEDIFLYVGRNFAGSPPQPFVHVVERRLTQLRRKGIVSFDRRAKAWTLNSDTLSAA